MNILLTISSAGVYGAESMVLNLLQSLRSVGCRPILAPLWNSHHPNAELATLARQRGIEVELIRCQGRFDFSVIRQIRQHVRKYRIDIVHSHGYKADLYSYLATRQPRVPLVATCHNWTDLTAAVSLYGRLDRLALTRFDRVAAVSEAVAGILTAARVPPNVVSIIPNGVPTEQFVAADSGKLAQLENHTGLVVGMVGRLVKDKGFDYVLRGARQLLAEFPDTRFLLVGDGPQREELLQISRDQSLQENVLFAGYSSDLPRVYGSMDILVLPSFVEGMPMVVLEAMAAGKPVVATRVGAIPSIVTQGHNGLLINPGDSSALIEALRRLLGDAALRKRMGEQGQALIHRSYSARIMAQRYLTLYSQAFKRRRAQSSPVVHQLEDLH